MTFNRSPISAAVSTALLYSLFGIRGLFKKIPRTFSPRISTATAERSELSTPPEYAIARDLPELRSSFNLLNLASVVLFIAGIISVFYYSPHPSSVLIILHMAHILDVRSFTFPSFRSSASSFNSSLTSFSNSIL